MQGDATQNHNLTVTSQKMKCMPGCSILHLCPHSIRLSFPFHLDISLQSCFTAKGDSALFLKTSLRQPVALFPIFDSCSMRHLCSLHLLHQIQTGATSIFKMLQTATKSAGQTNYGFPRHSRAMGSRSQEFSLCQGDSTLIRGSEMLMLPLPQKPP